MQATFKDIVLEIINIIDYPNDKAKFVRDFLELNNSNAMLNLLEKLPQETQEKIKATKNPNDIKKYINQQEYETEVTKVSIEALEKFIEAITPSLTPTQKAKVVKVLQAE